MSSAISNCGRLWLDPQVQPATAQPMRLDREDRGDLERRCASCGGAL